MQEMTYQIGDGWGDFVDNPSTEQMQQFLNKLDIDDEEHCEVWLIHDDTGWTLSCTPKFKIVFYRDEDDEEYKPRHLKDVPREKMLELWQKLAEGRLEELEKEPWKPGHSSQPPPPPFDPKEVHRSFWDELVNSNRVPDLLCRADKCKELAVEYTVFCPKHFFESVVKIECPFV